MRHMLEAYGISLRHFMLQRVVLDQLCGMGVKFDEEIQGLWLLNTLPDSFETLRVSLTNFAPSGVVTMKYAKSGVLNEVMRRRSQGLSSSTSHSDVWLLKIGEKQVQRSE
ncbi:hypothetical protein KY289_030245 [Solanum tuberosum]|nr:hypothetical protein KY289_030245 [Solanum tuberosum]